MNQLVFIVLAVYKPNKAFFLKQLHSIKHQTYKDFVCLCLADGPHSPFLDEISSEINDSRFIFTATEKHMGVFNTFGLGLEKIPDEAKWVAFCDQDDIWHQEKLATSLSTLKSKNAELVYSDARMIDASDNVLADSYFKYRRRVKISRFHELFLKNSISGMSMVFSTRIAKLSLPFIQQKPPLIFYHDGWVCLVAMANAKITYIDKALLDYRIHANNTSGEKKPVKRLSHILTNSILIIVRPFKMKRSIAIYSLRAKIYRLLQKHIEKGQSLHEIAAYFKHKQWFLFYLKVFYECLKQGELYRAKTVLSMLCAKIYLYVPFTRNWAMKHYKNADYLIKKMKVGI